MCCATNIFFREKSTKQPRFFRENVPLEYMYICYVLEIIATLISSIKIGETLYMLHCYIYLHISISKQERLKTGQNIQNASNSLHAL